MVKMAASLIVAYARNHVNRLPDFDHGRLGWNLNRPHLISQSLCWIKRDHKNNQMRIEPTRGDRPETSIHPYIKRPGSLSWQSTQGIKFSSAGAMPTFEIQASQILSSIDLWVYDCISNYASAETHRSNLLFPPNESSFDFSAYRLHDQTF